MSEEKPTQSKEAHLEEAQSALDRLQSWVASARDDELEALSARIYAFISDTQNRGNYTLRRSYPENFVADKAYRATLPDIQNTPSSKVGDQRYFIQNVGISNFRLPLRFKVKGGGQIELDAKITGTVSLGAEKKCYPLKSSARASMQFLD